MDHDAADQAKATLHRYLNRARLAVVAKLDGLSEYDVRRPLVPTGTNLLGLVKHLAGVEAGYLGATFGRPFPDEPLPWFAQDAEPNADLWATPQESREELVALYQRVWAHSDATIAALPLDAAGQVAWWPPERNPVTLHEVLVHLTTETHRHAGHADLLRELIDGVAGLTAPGDNLWVPAESTWQQHYDRVEAAARTFGR